MYFDEISGNTHNIIKISYINEMFQSATTTKELNDKFCEIESAEKIEWDLKSQGKEQESLCEWLFALSIKERQAEIKKIIHLFFLKRKFEIETKNSLIKEIQQTKKISQLKKIQEGYISSVGNINIEINNLNKRLDSIIERMKLVGIDAEKCRQQIINVYKRRITLLRKKKVADWLAILLTLIISAAVGFIGGVAIMMILPTMGMSAFIATFIVFALAAGITEGLVFHPYNKKFCRGLIANGFFTKLKHFILNREAKKNKQHRTDLTLKERKKIISKHRWEIRIKKFLTVLTAPLSLITGLGFSALLFSHIVELMGFLGLTFAGIAGGPLIPALIALAVGLAYATVMFGMFYRAIKMNIFRQIINEIILLFSVKNLKELDNTKKITHILAGIFKFISFGIVLTISIAATFFTAGAWFYSSVSFFRTTLHATNLIATQIAAGIIAAIMFATTAWFDVENSLATIKTITSTHWMKTAKTLNQEWGHFIKNPGIFLFNLFFKVIPTLMFKTIINFIPFIIHVAGTGAVAVQGGANNSIENILGGITGTVSEILVDLHAVIGDDEHHEHAAGHCDHNHDLAGTLGNTAKNFMSGVKEFFDYNNSHSNAKTYLNNFNLFAANSEINTNNQTQNKDVSVANINKDQENNDFNPKIISIAHRCKKNCNHFLKKEEVNPVLQQPSHKL